MTDSLNKLAKTIEAVLGDKAASVRVAHAELTVEVAPEHLHEAMLTLRDNDDTRFEQLLDVAGVDYAAYGQDEWITDASSVGFSRGVTGTGADVGRLGITGIYGVHDIKENTGRRFCATYHLLSISLNHRMRVKTYAADDAFPVIDSVVDIWSGANWFEREAFDLYGIVFDGHPDLRRILTDYGFVGHPFRKDFPLIGNVEVRYDDEKGRVIYQPVTIEPRVLVPRVVREDSRYADRIQQEGQADG